MHKMTNSFRAKAKAKPKPFCDSLSNPNTSIFDVCEI